MATPVSTYPMTLQDIQDRVHVLASSDPTTPTPDDDQYKTRLSNINNAISRWARQDVLWRELFATYTLATSITAGQTQYPIPNTINFRTLGSLVTCQSGNSIVRLDVINAEDRIKYQNGGQFVYLTGNIRDGFVLNLGWTPQAGDNLIGYTMTIDYFKAANRLAATTDIPEMSDPDYICYWAAAQELIFNGSNNLAQNYLAEADAALDNMRIKNVMMPAYASQEIPDVDLVRNLNVWGE